VAAIAAMVNALLFATLPFEERPQADRWSLRCDAVILSLNEIHRPICSRRKPLLVAICLNCIPCLIKSDSYVWQPVEKLDLLAMQAG